MACGTNGRIIAANAGTYPLLRYPILVGRSVEELVPAELRGYHAALRASMLRDPRPRPMMVVTGDKDGDEPTRTVRAVRGDGTEVPVDIGLTPVVVDGTMVVMMTLVDGTEHQRMLTTMAQRDAAALAAAEYRNAMLLSTLSHELRTLLVGVMGNLEVLATMPMPPAQRELAAAAFTCAKAVLDTANAILDHAKLEAGAVALEHLAFLPREVLREVGTIMGMRMSSKGLAWRVDVAPDVPAVVVGDPSRLRQILLNLVGNAVKFTATGGVTVSVVREGTGIELPGRPGEVVGGAAAVLSGGGAAAALAAATAAEGETTPVAAPLQLVRLAFTVADTGVGIPADMLPELGEPFVQADASVARKFGGTGLGLSITKMLAELMGGALTLTSTVGVGTQVHFGMLVDVAPGTSAADGGAATPTYLPVPALISTAAVPPLAPMPAPALPLPLPVAPLHKVGAAGATDHTAGSGEVSSETGRSGAALAASGTADGGGDAGVPTHMAIRATRLRGPVAVSTGPAVTPGSSHTPQTPAMGSGRGAAAPSPASGSSGTGGGGGQLHGRPPPISAASGTAHDAAGAATPPAPGGQDIKLQGRQSSLVCRRCVRGGIRGKV